MDFIFFTKIGDVIVLSYSVKRLLKENNLKDGVDYCFIYPKEDAQGVNKQVRMNSRVKNVDFEDVPHNSAGKISSCNL